MRTRLRAAERRRQLITIASRLFSEHGYHGLSMEQLAEAAGVSKPVLYQHFPSKRELYLALVGEAVQEMEKQVRSALEGTTDNRARVEGAIAAYFDFVEDPRFRLVFATAELGDDAVRREVDGAIHRVADQIAALIAEDAELHEDAARFLANAVRGLAAEGARWWIEQSSITKEEAVRILARLAWRGLGSFGTPPPGSGTEDAPGEQPPSRS
ncbi:TetR/AcrR family transcriptional regulator [Egibacter rhizosphaerae]|uniref:TetR/AcrR family transcriptional regulator n=1 Tax=Egibacter rhizosphaerae TaxID=1670831 RepID=A0A411YCK8_9ACTN|nr:TetR/AcrR family transcriptional regulator [Egibacter rhizosphaerae]QBI18926.1 TetR/AcrR family transcriptional regulator [Egibacter rhizosphaerae]